MIDILFLTCNRLEFTRATLAALIANTDWDHVRRFIWYDDNSKDGTIEYMTDATAGIPVPIVARFGHWGGPVAAMVDYLRSRDTTAMFAKIDNDTLVPAGWLTECLKVMDRHPELGLLGIEAFDPVVAEPTGRTYRKAEHIGGIGLMRAQCFAHSLPQPRGRFGFTEWQHDTGNVTKGWLTPALPVRLLDRMPSEPWASLSKQYIAEGLQRPWPTYHWRRDANIWAWVQDGVNL